MLQPGPKRFNVAFLLSLTQVVCAKLVAGGSAVLINVALFRYLDTASFGLIGVCLAFVLLVDGVLGSALDMSVLKLAPSREGPSALAIHSCAILTKLAVGALFGVIAFIFRSSLSNSIFHSSDHGALIVWTIGAITAMLLLRSAQVYVQTSGEFGRYGRIDVAHGTLRIAGIAFLILCNTVTPLTVLAVFTIAPLIPFASWAARHADVIAAWRPGLHVFPEIWRAIRWILLTFTLASMISRLDVVLVSKWGSLKDAGLYSAALVFAMVVQIAGSYVAVLLTPKVAPALADGTFGTLFRDVQLALYAAGAIGFLLFLVAWRMFGHIVLPPAYTQAGDITQILMIGAIAGFMTFPLTLTFVMFVRPRFLFLMDCATVPLFIAANYYAIPRFGAVGAAVITAVANAGRALIVQVLAWRWSREFTSEQISTVSPVASPLHP